MTEISFEDYEQWAEDEAKVAAAWATMQGQASKKEVLAYGVGFRHGFRKAIAVLMDKKILKEKE